MATAIINLSSLLSKLTKLENIESEVKKGIQKGALRVEASAKDLCPVETGNLRASIKTEVAELEAAVGTNVNYAEYVELGTNKMAAQPYLYPALASNKQKILEDVAKAIKGGVKI
jgi:HK97 gp10 family phage protein